MFWYEEFWTITLIILLIIHILGSRNTLYSLHTDDVFKYVKWAGQSLVYNAAYKKYTTYIQMLVVYFL